jgi:hypothetical protein
MNSSSSPNIASVQNPYGVEEGAIPYPEDCVFFVTGADVTREPASLTIEQTGSAVVVARRADVAKDGFLLQAKSSHLEHWEAFAAYSLKQIRRAMAPRPEEIVEIHESQVAKIFGNSKIWIVEEIVDGKPLRSYLSAHSADAVYAYLAKDGRHNASFFPIEQLKAAVKKMEAARDGDMEHAFYAVDLDGDELTQQKQQMWKEASPEKKAWLNAWQKRHGRPAFDCTIAA